MEQETLLHPKSGKNLEDPVDFHHPSHTDDPGNFPTLTAYSTGRLLVFWNY
jgi:hypothetical protein